MNCLRGCRATGADLGKPLHLLGFGRTAANMPIAELTLVAVIKIDGAQSFHDQNPSSRLSSIPFPTRSQRFSGKRWLIQSASGYFDGFRPFELLAACPHALGDNRATADIELLHRWSDFPELGPIAIDAIRRLEGVRSNVVNMLAQRMWVPSCDSDQHRISRKGNHEDQEEAGRHPWRGNLDSGRHAFRDGD